MAQQPDMPKKPLNSFMLYRRDLLAELKATNPIIKTSDVSRIASERWANESADTRERYGRLSNEGFKNHRELYPDYKWPGRKKNQDKGITKNISKEMKPKSPLRVNHTMQNLPPFLHYPNSIITGVHRWDHGSDGYGNSPPQLSPMQPATRLTTMNQVSASYPHVDYSRNVVYPAFGIETSGQTLIRRSSSTHSPLSPLFPIMSPSQLSDSSGVSDDIKEVFLKFMQ
jgi:hypothetical protein